MPGTITVREVLRRWSVLLQDSDPQFSRSAESEGIDWLNEAQSLLFTYLPVACSRIDTVRLIAGAFQQIESIPAADVKLFDGSVPTVPVIGTAVLDVMVNMGANGTTVGKAIRPLLDGRAAIDALNPSWHMQTDATEVQHFIFDPRFPRHFMVYPPVPATRLWVRMSLVAQPAKVPNAGETGYASYAASGSNQLAISVHDEHMPDILNYMMARTLMKNAQYAASLGMTPDTFVQLFVGSINAKSMALMGVNPNLKALPLTPAMPGTAS
jgi:hypothetical protein